MIKAEKGYVAIMSTCVDVLFNSFYHISSNIILLPNVFPIIGMSFVCPLLSTRTVSVLSSFEACCLEYYDETITKRFFSTQKQCCAGTEVSVSSWLGLVPITLSVDEEIKSSDNCVLPQHTQTPGYFVSQQLMGLFYAILGH